MKRVQVTITYITELPDDGWIYDVVNSIHDGLLPTDANVYVHYPHSGGQEGRILGHKPTIASRLCSPLVVNQSMEDMTDACLALPCKYPAAHWLSPNHEFDYWEFSDGSKLRYEGDEYPYTPVEVKE